ncbi:hypothetical protein DFH08DRAFT_890228 [Mycena albidolilacea]|uniref:Uncharacterized protein n=1 Tax=Mycena albidolilacea TaxID=1033008 RepID=A0AAD7EFD7_9AGAR|nr:hypothetical protein DFH08DRAFT_890228 [Mycena albidolilacea]
MQGPVRVKDHGRRWFFNDNWLVLTEAHLALHPSANTAPRAIIPLSDIVKLERSEHESHGLILETRGRKTYLLSFKNDNDIYDWKDAISCRTTGIGDPWNFVHKVHVGWNPAEQAFTSLPDEWRKLLSLGKPDREHSSPMVANESQSSAVLLRHRPSAPLPQFRVSSGRIVLRISINTPTDPGHTSVGLSVLPDTSMRNVLAHVCQKTNLETTGCSLVLASDSGRTPLDMNTTIADLDSGEGLVLLTPEGRFPDLGVGEGQPASGK